MRIAWFEIQAVGKADHRSPRKRGTPNAGYNLKRILNLVSFEELMQAVGTKVSQSA